MQTYSVRQVQGPLGEAIEHGGVVDRGGPVEGRPAARWSGRLWLQASSFGCRPWSTGGGREATAYWSSGPMGGHATPASGLFLPCSMGRDATSQTRSRA